MDFVALMKYGGPDERLARVLDLLEAGSPEEVQALARLLHERGFGLGHKPEATWEFTSRPELRDPRLAHRPSLPNLGVALWLPEGFSLTFGPDGVEVYHLLRWHFFLTEPDLQLAVLDACRCLAHLFAVTDCIITSDFSPVVEAFRKGQGFDDSLASAGPEDGERASLADLYLEIPEDYVMREVTLPDGQRRTQHRDWDREKPPPEGWERATTWSSSGFWRPGIGPCIPAAISQEIPPVVPRRRAPPVAAAGWGIGADDPDAILDYLLKQDGVSWRKVLLWACACLRRVWPLLATEPVKRAVEVAERFVDGQVNREVVEKARSAARSVRKGNRSANQAACLLAELCSGIRRFPPGEVSAAVLDALMGDSDDQAARTAERMAQIDLLHDLFGPLPYRPVTIGSHCLTQTVGMLARSTSEERALPEGRLDNLRPGVLADALEEAGADASLIAHLRDPGPHVPGCWAVDLRLGKG
jgi:hypothetical protein